MVPTQTVFLPVFNITQFITRLQMRVSIVTIFFITVKKKYYVFGVKRVCVYKVSTARNINTVICMIYRVEQPSNAFAKVIFYY